MELSTPEQIARVYEVTDGLGLHRNAVIVPLKARDEGMEMIMPDGRVLIRPPGGDAPFEAWFTGLTERLEALDLRRPRAVQ